MKNFFKKSIMLMVAFVTISTSVEAQKVVGNINTRDAQACGSYLTANPSDTIRNEFNLAKDGMRGKVMRSVYLQNGKLIAFNDTTWFKQDIKSVQVTKKQVVVASQLTNAAGEVKTDTVVWDRQSTKEISFETKEAVLRGEVRMFDPHHKNYDGYFRHKVQATVLGGGLISSGNFSPVLTGRLGYESCHFLFELQGSLSRSKYTETAEESGKYTSFAVQFNTGWKFLQDRRSRHFLAILGTVGYGYQRTDGDDTEARSRNYGLIAGGMLRGSLGLTNHLRLVAESGYRLVPKVNHNEEQDLNNGGVFFNVGVGCTW